MSAFQTKHVEYNITLLDIMNEIETACVDGLFMDSAKDLRTAPESNFNYCLRKVGAKFFKDTDYFRGDDINNININNAFNTNKISNMLDIYYELCERFAKIPSLLGFCLLVGVDYVYITERYIKNNIVMGNDNINNNIINNNIYNSADNSSSLYGAPSPSWTEIHKNIVTHREQALRSKLSDGKQNPVGIIALMNNEYNFNGDKPESAQDRKCLSVNDLKSLLSVTSGQHRINDYVQNKQRIAESRDNTGFDDSAK